ncbi:unnamed protein product [Rhizophagus irregularis]|nr:unnamed protein product [Rhizophagus irregularis]
MQSWRLDNLISDQLNNVKLTEGLKLVQSRSTTGSLVAYDKFELDELFRFRQIYSLEIEDTIASSEPFPEEMLTPKKINVGLPDETYNILVEYYKAAYDLEFLSISELAQGNTRCSGRKIVIRPQINQFRRIRIGAEIFRSANSPRYSKNLFILAKFVQENESVEIFPS